MRQLTRCESRSRRRASPSQLTAINTSQRATMLSLTEQINASNRRDAMRGILREYVDHLHADIAGLLPGRHQQHGGFAIRPLHGMVMAWWRLHTIMKGRRQTLDQRRPGQNPGNLLSGDGTHFSSPVVLQ